MRKDKKRAIELRKRNKSYKEISRRLGIPIATLCGWFKNLPWSQEIKNKLAKEASFSSPAKLKLMVAATKKRWALIHEQYRQEAEIEFQIKKFNPLFIAGVMLYWGEGSKILERGRVELSNSDPGMVKLFYRSLYEEMGISRTNIFARLLLYPDLKDEMQKRAWSKLSGIPLRQFKNSVTIIGRHSIKRLSNGVCSILVHNNKLLRKLLRWIELYQEIPFRVNAGVS